MPQIIDGGRMTFDALVYGQMHPGTQQFLASQFEAPTAMLTQAGQRFFADTYEIYDRLAGSTALRALKAIGRAVGSIWQTDEIRYVYDIAQLQHAPLKMQRFIMAMPDLRQMYHEQRVDGYSDTYVDVHPGAVGMEHYDYRRVVDGHLFIDDEADPDSNWHATTFFEELLPEDQELTLEEQRDILDTWRAVRASLDHNKEDPTSRFNADIG